MKLKPNMFLRIFVMVMKYLILVIIQLTQCRDLNKLVVSKIKDETGGVSIKKKFIQAICFW